MKILIFITIDSLRYDCFNDLLASLPRGWKYLFFERFYSTGPYTWASFPAIFTSSYPFILNYKKTKSIKNRLTFVEILHKHGYQTIGYTGGNIFLTSNLGYAKGFDKYEELIGTSKSTSLKIITQMKSFFFFKNILNRIIFSLKEQIKRKYYNKDIKGLTYEIHLHRSFYNIMLLYARILKNYFKLLRNNMKNTLCFNSYDIVKNVIQDIRKANKKSLFLWLHFMDLHIPFSCYVEESERFHYMLHSILYEIKSGGFLKVDSMLNRLHKELYLKSLKYLSKVLHFLFKQLNELKIVDDIYVIITSDHGEEFLEHDGLEHVGLFYFNIRLPHLYEENLHVPLIIASPNLNKNNHLAIPCTHIDLAPTIINIAGIEQSVYERIFMGQNLFKSESAGSESRPLFHESEALFINTLEDKQYTFGLAYAVHYRNYKYIWHPFLGEHLFDLEKDPAEKYDIKSTEEEVLRCMRKLLSQYIREKTLFEIKYKVKRALSKIELS